MNKSLLAAIALYSFAAPAQETSSSRVLFAGNSYTFFHNLPHVVQALAESRGLRMDVRTSVKGGATLEQHWNGERGLVTRSLIATGQFDFVVFQEQSMRPVQEPDNTIEHAALLCGDAVEAGAQPVLFLTWARKKLPQMQEALNETYARAADNGNAVVAPVGKAWQRALALRPDMSLHGRDGSHPSKLGTYLAACVFFVVLTGEDPMALPNEPMTEDVDGKMIQLMRIDKADAEFCQRVARDLVNVE